MPPGGGPVNDPVDLPPELVAGLVAPAVDRLVLGALRAAQDAGGLDIGLRYGGPAATGFLVEFRTRLAIPGGTISEAAFAVLTRHRDPVECRRILDRQVAHGMIQRTEWNGLRATERGLAYLAEIHELHGRVTEQLWAGHPGRAARLVGMVGRLLVRAARPGPNDEFDPAQRAEADDDLAPELVEAGSAFHSLGPPHEPDGTPDGVLLLNRLSTFRHYRADARAAAYAAAGYPEHDAEPAPAGPLRSALDGETNRLTAGPYRALVPTERLALLADLAALPG